MTLARGRSPCRMQRRAVWPRSRPVGAAGGRGSRRAVRTRRYATRLGQPSGYVRTAELVLGLLAVIALLGVFADRSGLPYPAVLVLGGIAFGLIPGFPAIQLRPRATRASTSS